MNSKNLDRELREALSRTRPPIVRDVRCRHGADSTGDPAIWLWLIVGDDVDVETRYGELQAARVWAEGAAAPAAGQRWVYVAFRTESEQAELESAT